MQRLIDATRIQQYILNNCSDNEEINAIYGEIINAPTVNVCPYWDNESDYCALMKPSDAVPVVQCRDCKHYRHDDVFHRWYCSTGMTKRATSKDDFCSWGERREDA